jgi:surface polysaccharide O-acyltransferase-like enzyme
MASICTFALVKQNGDSLPRLPGFMKRISRDCVGIYLVHPVPLDVLNHLGLLGRYPNLLIGIPILTVVVVVSSIGMVRIIRALKLDRILFP